MNNERYLLVVSGPSGAGKDTVVKQMLEQYTGMEKSVSATTRAMRPGEKEGVNYYYITQDAFEDKIAKAEVLEYTQYCGNYYGTLKSEVDARLSAGITVILVIEVQGAGNVKRMYPDCTTVFVRPPSYEELERRLIERGTENEASIKARLKRAVEEMEYAVDYDYVVVNDDVKTCAEAIHTIVVERQAN